LAMQVVALLAVVGDGLRGDHWGDFFPKDRGKAGARLVQEGEKVVGR
jgi:hypothetical protein